MHYSDEVNFSGVFVVDVLDCLIVCIIIYAHLMVRFFRILCYNKVDLSAKLYAFDTFKIYS